jgi:hypothetical protein
MMSQERYERAFRNCCCHDFASGVAAAIHVSCMHALVVMTLVPFKVSISWLAVHGYSQDGLTCSSTGTLDWQAGKAFLDLLQGAWGYRRVLSAFGDTILTPTGTMKNDVPSPCCPSMQDVHLV